MSEAVEHANTVKNFFRNNRGVGLLLPDGWFGGRPMENQHDLTLIVERPKRLLIELDDQLLLSFSPTFHVELTTSKLAMSRGTDTLVIERFGQCVFDYLEYV